jgi:hypothetical protein
MYLPQYYGKIPAAYYSGLLEIRTAQDSLITVNGSYRISDIRLKYSSFSFWQGGIISLKLFIVPDGFAVE